MNKIFLIIYLLIFGCVTKQTFKKHPDNQEVTQNIINEEIVHVSPETSTFITFIIIILSVTFFCFGLKYLPILYKRIKALTKKDK